ncbi:MAG: hypothetical protein J6T98_00730 [Salinivirgaceae bacterium]|nr:hypothetical protein [Salinivirgaceae bacterium]
MGKTSKPTFLDYLNAVKKADREREIAQHGKLISTRPLRIVKSKKVYDRNRKKEIVQVMMTISFFYGVGYWVLGFGDWVLVTMGEFDIGQLRCADVTVPHFCF